MSDPTPTDIKIEESPQASVAKPAAAPGPAGVVYVADSKGRRIGLKKPGPVERFELDDAVATKTQSAAMQVSVVGCVVSIDDDGLPSLWTYEKPRVAFLQRLTALGDEGLMAITPAALKLFGLDLTEDVVDKVKNS